MGNLIYLHLPAGGKPPTLSLPAFKAVVVINQDVTNEWRDLVSDWLVASGCLYMMAWGQECSAWDDSVDHAMLKVFDYNDVPDDRFVMTTWHENQPLSEPFWFSAFAASHPIIKLTQTVILDINAVDRERELLDAYEEAINQPL
ncbi:hypothetical protein [Sphingomonas sp.]|uniref:DUF7684 family protein n=1 Tax=Sphingomonas sp. TaxID=28214 RepID=UPI001E13646F|nr:hypothetical protein [Sphingomonas sp.]MBX9796229.1 hypothetical protein [Sphingomonas sp.]